LYFFAIMFRRNLLVLFLICLFIAIPAAGKPLREKSKRAPSLILESANSNENTLLNGELISVLRGNVVFVYDDIRIRSDEATWWRKRGTVAFNNNIKVVRGKQRITCKRMNFTKDNNLLTATGNFDFYDSAALSRLHGNDAEYHISQKIFRLKGDPVLIRYDTVKTETLTIRSITMSYVDSLKRATGTDSVRIRKGPLFSTCGLVHYFTNTNKALLRRTPQVWYGIHYLSGDSINLDFTKESLRDASIKGGSHGIYADTSGGQRGDTAYTHLWGDSLYMAVSDSGRLDVIWAVGKAASKNYRNSEPAIANTANGKIMMLGFGRDGNVRNLKIWGNARSTYFVMDSSGRGCNEVSGDSVSVVFAQGKAQFVTLAGGTRGIYFAVP
jgi:lipopolysaccharide export system protein LptA